MPTERKVQLVAEIKELLESARIAIATSYQGVPVSQQTELRNQLATAGVQFRVVKNTLLKRAADAAGQPLYAELSEGPTAIAVSEDDVVGAAKALTAYISTHANTPIAIRRAVIEGRLVDAAYVADLATVPPREELLSRIAGGLVGKIRELMGLLQATTRDFAGLIEARAAQLEGGDGRAPAAEAPAASAVGTEEDAGEGDASGAAADEPAEASDEASETAEAAPAD